MKNIYCTYLSTILYVAASAEAAHPDRSPDFQVRIPFHLQCANLRTNTLGGFGLAAWSIFTDVTAEHNETGTLDLFGPLWRYDKKGSWLEIMGGLKQNDGGYTDPVVDFRLLDRTFPRLNIAAELAYFPRKERERFYVFVAGDTPVSIGKYTARIGFESENILSSSKADSLGIGPRLVLPIPMKRISPSLSSSITIAYQYRNDRDFFRIYAGMTYVFGKK